MKDELFRQFYINFFATNIILFILITAFLFSIFILVRAYIKKIPLTNAKSFILVFFITLAGILYFGLQSAKVFKDYTLVKNNECLVFEGEFIRYTVYTESNTPGEPNKSKPLFTDIYSGEEMIFSVNGDFVVGESYTIYYLPNTTISILFYDGETIGNEN